MGTTLTINNFKSVMIAKAKKRGCLWENFGDDEIRKLKDKYNYNLYANQYSDPKELKIQKSIDALSDWAMNFDLSQL